MELEIHVPEEVPVMTLPNVAFFPQALLPLRIFERRYRRMLEDVLGLNRIFAVAGINPGAAGGEEQPEPPHRIASLGLIRACQKNDDGTFNLLIQGLCRVSILEILGEEPYRRIRVQALASTPGAPLDENARLRGELSRLVQVLVRLSASGGRKMGEFLSTIEDPEIFSDIAAFNLCEDAGLKQTLLETLDVNRRLLLLLRRFRGEIQSTMLRKKLQGGLPDAGISLN